MRFAGLLALATSASAGSIVGFSYGATNTAGVVNQKSDFQSMFTAAKNLAGANGKFSSARLYTTIQGGTTSSPISAISAAVDSQTPLLLGMWASAGQTVIDNEIAALKSAISLYGSKFTSLVQGLSIGSEDLYRVTPTSLMNDPNSVGAGPDQIVSYIKRVRQALSGTALAQVKIGHVDTWTAWVNGSNSAVINEVDWVGMNTFPYFQTTDSNPIAQGPALFRAAYAATQGAAGSKEVYITETGWPISGKLSGQAVASKENAKAYYDEVGCNELFGKVNTWWYTLVDGNTDPNQPAFGIASSNAMSTPQFDLSCKAVSSSSSSSSAASSSAAATSSISGAPKASTTASAGASSVVSSVISLSTVTSGAAIPTSVSGGGAGGAVTSVGTASRTSGAPVSTGSTVASGAVATSFSAISALSGLFAVLALL